jgi:hypothetical protein
MATNNNCTTCNKCGTNAKCGCADSYLTTPLPCPTPIECPAAQICSETFDSQCITYTGESIICNGVTVVNTGDNVHVALNSIIDYFCTLVPTPPNQTVVEGDITTNVTSNVVGNIITYTVSIEDTGWVDLEGFAYYQGGMAGKKPQVRRIGKQIHFRGDLIVPITDGSNVIPVTAIDTYRTVMRKTPFAATGGVYFDSDDIMYFNSTGAAGGIVIPTSVLPTGTDLDGNYKLTREIASRQLRVFNTTDPDLDEPGTALLHAPVEISITATKQLKLSALSVLEQNSADVVSFVGSSSLRNITSSFKTRSFMLNFRSFLTGGDGLNSMRVAPVNSGTTIVGIQYYIENYQVGDDFTNVGALANANYVSFTSTGTVPTNWTNGSRLVIIPDMLQSYDFFYPNLGSNNSSQWPALLDSGLLFDGADPYDLGGYTISLDGLMAYIQ